MRYPDENLPLVYLSSVVVALRPRLAVPRSAPAAPRHVSRHVILFSTIVHLIHVVQRYALGGFVVARPVSVVVRPVLVVVLQMRAAELQASLSCVLLRL